MMKMKNPPKGVLEEEKPATEQVQGFIDHIKPSIVEDAASKNQKEDFSTIQALSYRRQKNFSCIGHLMIYFIKCKTTDSKCIHVRLQHHLNHDETELYKPLLEIVDYDKDLAMPVDYIKYLED